MIRRAPEELEQAKRLERGLVIVRWVGIVLGVYLISQTNTGSPPYGGSLVVLLGEALMGLLAAWNIAVWVLTERLQSVTAMRRLGLACFAVDTAVVFAIAWLNSYDPKGAAWVVIYILPLEGAVRYRLTGALITVAVTFCSELAREAYLANRFDDYPFLMANVVLRVGVQAIVALVAGFMSRSLAREAENAAEQARRFQEAARRESLASRELAAFNTAILTGMAVEDPDMAIQLMAGAIGRDLGFETFVILLREGDDLVARGVHGLPVFEEPIPLGHGVTGTVAATGRAMLVPDVSEFAGYIETDPDVHSEMAAPLRIGDDVIGVVDVQSRAEGGFDDAALGLLTRLADQITLLIHRARLHAQQRETLERLRELDQMKSDFVAIASHELRTPLSAIHGYVTTLARRWERLSPEESRRFLDTISRQSERMARLVEDLLLVSKIEAGTIRINALQVTVAAVLDGTVESLGPEERSRVRLELSDGDGPAGSGPGGPGPSQPHRECPQVLPAIVAGGGSGGDVEREGSPVRDGPGNRHPAREPSPRVRAVPSGRVRAHPSGRGSRARALHHQTTGRGHGGNHRGDVLARIGLDLRGGAAAAAGAVEERSGRAAFGHGLPKLLERLHQRRQLIGRGATAGIGEHPDPGLAHPVRLLTHHRLGPAEGDAVGGDSQECHRVWPKAPDLSFQPSGALPQLLPAQLIRIGSGPLHQVGHTDPHIQ
jgi:signal transduction histidine kinase